MHDIISEIGMFAWDHVTKWIGHMGPCDQVDRTLDSRSKGKEFDSY